MAYILCNFGGNIGWRDENNTSGLYKYMKSSANTGWHLGQDAGTYLFRDGSNVGWRYKSFVVALGSKSVGSIVKIKINNADTNFIVVQHGRPGALYDSSFDGGTILLAQIEHSPQAWGKIGDSGSSWNVTYQFEYSGSINPYLRDTYYNLVDPQIRNLIKQVNLLAGYVTHIVGQGPTTPGSQTFATKIFIPSVLELGFTPYSDYNFMYPVDGSIWNYFSSGGNPVSSSEYWTRTPFYERTGIKMAAFSITPSGFTASTNNLLSYQYYIRAAFVLPQTVLVNDNGNVIPA